MNEEEKKIYEAAIGKWGETMQLVVAVEELAELQQAIAKAIRSRTQETVQHVMEEAADVSIMLEQIGLIFSEDVEKNGLKAAAQIKAEKIERLHRRLQGGNV